MRTDKEIREEARRIRERAKALSGFWIPELAAAAYALEWALGKREESPSQDVGKPSSAHGKLAESLLKAAQTQPPPPAKRAGAKKSAGRLRRLK